MHIIQTVSFPGLGIGPFELDRVALTLFGKPIYWYGILFALAFLAAILYILRRAPEFGLDGDRVMDVVIGAVVLGIVGARTYYVAFSWDFYKDNLLQVFNLRNGGIAMYGSIIGGVIGGWLVCRWRKVKFLPMADAALTGVIAGQAIGRWGNFVNVEAFGSVTDLPWRMCSPQAAQYLLNTNQIDQATADQIVAGTLGVHPTFFYESVWCLLGFLLLAWFTSRRRYDGQLVLLYCAWYGAERAVVEGLRTDSLYWGGVRVSQALAAVLVVVSVCLLVYLRRREKRGDLPALYVNTEEGRAVVNGTFYRKKDAAPAEEPAAEPAGRPEEAGEAAEEPTEGEAAANSAEEAESAEKEPESKGNPAGDA